MAQHAGLVWQASGPSQSWAWQAALSVQAAAAQLSVWHAVQSQPSQVQTSSVQQPHSGAHSPHGHETAVTAVAAVLSLAGIMKPPKTPAANTTIAKEIALIISSSLFF